MTRCSATLLIAILVGAGRVALTQSPAVHAPDGGTRQMITSIAVPPMPNAPFSATVNTEWTRYLDDGATLTVRNHRLIARDGLGRVFQERRGFVPLNGPPDSRLTATEIADPRTHTIAYCGAAQRECDLRFFVGLPPAVQAISGPTPRGAVTTESLGTQTISGFDSVGTRETLTLKGTAIGADRPVSVVKEFWYSAQLGLNLSTRRTDPRSGIEMFTVTDINPSEPDQKLFDLPQGARVIDLRPARR